MRNLSFNRLVLMTEDQHNRRKILRWLFLHYRVYSYEPTGKEVRARFITRKPFRTDALRGLTDTLHSDSTLHMRIISTDLYTLYLEAHVYRFKQWFRILP